MSRRTDEDFEAIIHEDAEAEPTPLDESEDGKHMHEVLEPAHADTVDS